MSKILVLYYSSYGHLAKLADAVAGRREASEPAGSFARRAATGAASWVATGAATRFKAGEYVIPAHSSPLDVVQMLVEGKTVTAPRRSGGDKSTGRPPPDRA